MQIGKFMLQFDMIMRVAANVARPARASAYVMQRIFHGGDDFGVLPHAEIVI